MKPFLSENKAIIQICLCTIMKGASVNTWKLYLFLEHQYQPVSSFLLTAAILAYPYLQLKHCLCTLHQ